MSKQFNISPLSRVSKIGLGLLSSLVFIVGCDTQNAQQYEATATTNITWRVNYSNDPTENKRGRYEKFDSVSLVNRNGEKPERGVVQDDKGLWWAQVPPKPSVDEIEAAKKRPYEKIGKPELLRTIDYRVTFQQDGQTVNLPTNYAVYRQVAKAYPNQTPLKFTLGINNGSVEKAEPIQ
ncbi:hypothetical protein [Myxosarcina sp. GI1]|uniref:hypothetical protein n=1 Tax=Myxosarcina sp. GI1 TaxID=1541065 RepID=UPI000563AAB1|nr:hypothetical protein [Myxosarcina sp. GI1]